MVPGCATADRHAARCEAAWVVERDRGGFDSKPVCHRLLMAARPGLVTQGLQVVQRVAARHLLEGAQLPNYASAAAQ